MIKKVLIWIIVTIIAVQVLVGALFYFFQFKFLFHATPLPKDYKYSFDQPFEEIYIKAGNARINGLYFKSREKRGCVVYFHGNADNLSRWGTIAPDFTTKGFDLVIVDFPTFGKSTGSINEGSLLAMGRKAFDFARQYYPPEKLVLYGRSMGSGIASKVAAETSAGLLILETPFSSMIDLVNHHAPRFTPTSIILRLRFDNQKNLQKVNCPVYIFHGTDDEIIPYSHGELLAKGLKKGDRFVTIKEGNHINLNQYKLYHEELNKALSLVL